MSLTEAALRARGEAIALESVKGDRVSYATLAGRARAVADLLVDGGVGPGARVALLSAGRGHDEAVGLVGIRLAGAVVVPLDASHPAGRWRAVAAGCGKLVHDQAATKKWAATGLSLGRVELDPDGFVLGATGAVDDTDGGERMPLDADTTAVLHTSGSTGRPKAIPIATAGMRAFTAWMRGLTELSAGDRVLRVAELGFDLAWFDHVATLEAGATLCTMPRRTMAAGAALAEAVRTLSPDVIYGVPAFFTKLVAAGYDFGGVRTICFAGEVFPPAELVRLAEVSEARLFNLFGPTETNVCTFHAVREEDLGGELPIGIACPYADCTLVDEAGHVVEGEGTGELVVEGPTALGGRYATRDRVERRDGLLYFRGRLDRMVKIRGYRVDPGEVEAALLRCEGVREAAVVTTHHPKLGLGLAAHVSGGVEPKGLRKAVAAELAPYMVPERVEVHEALPRTSTGKVDYAALE